MITCTYSEDLRWPIRKGQAAVVVEVAAAEEEEVVVEVVEEASRWERTPHRH